MPNPLTIPELTPAEARALISVLNFGLADIEAMNDGDLKTYKFGKRFFKLLNRGADKLRVIAHGTR